MDSVSASGRVAGKIFIVTGGASGLGAADARLLAQHGATVVITDTQEDAGRELAASTEGIYFLPQDVCDEQRWNEIVAEVEARFGGLDGLVNNAGIVGYADVEQCSLDMFRKHLAVMAEGTFLGCKAAIPAMVRRGGGAIVNMASTAAVKGIGTIPAYSAAKGAIAALTRSVAVHCQEKRYNIRVNTVIPGGHDTPMTRSAFANMDPDDPGLAHAISEGMGKPEDVANLVLYLLSDEARRVTGASMVIDHGETIR
ncbi:MAG: SDR family oxidoreductase [Sphingomonadaceae bacterium]